MEEHIKIQTQVYLGEGHEYSAGANIRETISFSASPLSFNKVRNLVK